MNARSALILLLLAFLPSRIARGEPVLKGIKNVHVSIGDLPAVAEKHGLSKAILRTDAEQKLHHAGIKVLESGSPEIFGAPFLQINVASIDLAEREEGQNRIAFYVSVELIESATLIRPPRKIVNGLTWERRYLGQSPYLGFESKVRNKVKDLLGKFLDDYMAANPKE